MTLPIHSIRWRIQAWHGALLLLVLTGFGAMAYRLQSTSESRHIDAELQLRATALLGNIAHQPRREPPPPRLPGGGGGEDDEDEDRPEPPPDHRRGPPPGDFRLQPELSPLFASANAGDGEAFYYRVWKRTGEVFGGSANAPVRLPSPRELPASEKMGNGIAFRMREGMREAVAVTPPGESIVVGIADAVRERAMARFAGWLLGLGAGILVLGLAGGWWLATRAIAPVAAIGAAARRIADGRLDERVPVAGTGSELDTLAVVLNGTFARLDAAFSEQARFTSDAAHELRTPVSVILAQTQLALARPRTADEYRDSLETTRRSAVRMQGLIESLLTLAQLDARSEPLRPRPCNLADIAREQLDHIRPLADERGIVLKHELAPAACTADPDRLAQIFVNLLSNAVKYTQVGGEVQLVSARVNGHAEFSVSDTGPGIAAEHLPHLFERFYRADASRNRTTGGAGLGLAICKTLAEAQGGTLEVSSVETQGSTFTLKIPAHD